MGGFALGALSYPSYAYPYYAYPYSTYGYPYYYPSTYPSTVYTAPAVSYHSAPAPQPVAVQREVVYPTGKYVLYGDGMTQPWQWIWIASPAPAALPPSQ